MKFFFSLLFVLIINPLTANTKLTLATKKFPLEMELILNFVQDQNLNSAQTEQLRNIIISIDRYARLLSDEELLFVTKTEVYKSFLKPNSNEPLKKEMYNPKFVSQIQIAKKQLGSLSFFSWFLTALEKDLDTLFASSEYKDLMLLKSSGKEIPSELLKIERRLDLSIKIAMLISNDDLAPFKNYLLNKSFNFLKNLENSFRLLCLYGRYQPLEAKVSIDNLQFFKVENQNKELANSTNKSLKTPSDYENSNEKSIDQILDPLLSKDEKPKKIEIPKPVGEDEWLLDSELNKITEPIKKELPKPMAEDDWLTDF